ncbi:hypothetical protein Bcep18194_B2198 [Burkholderia lata]|uniref:Uncharacterized protein n=1 Tax=Burkholderia lata (strain ATCC 17760 / DSM 23089 / LMG 22485 / NCIMB 9086 / R18194 / 383) TaxID=482957 RepID=Q393Q7_BURL3|nr:hypothetical protein Bcep18194_B2198 [Burkholderia lata]
MLTTQSLPLYVFSLPPHRSARRRLSRSRAGACNIPMHLIGQLPSGSGRRIESNEQDNETIALAIPPAPCPARLRRIAAQPSRYRVFRISPPEKKHLSGSGERPCRVRAIRTRATEIGGA